MTTIRANLISGTVSENPLGSGTLSLTMGGDLADLPSVGGGNIARLTIDPEGVDVLSGSGPEIVHVTAYTQGAGTATIVRGQEGTSGRPHSQGVKIVSAPTKADWDEKADLAGGTFTGGVNIPTLHVSGNASVDGASTLEALHVLTTSAFTGDATFSGSIVGPLAVITALHTISQIRADNGMTVPQGASSIEDATTTNRLFHHDSAFLYIGDIDGVIGSPHDVMFRASGVDAVQIRSSGDAIFRGNPPGSTTHESFRVAGFPSASVRGFAVNADGAAYQGGVTTGVSVAISRTDPGLSVNNAGGDSIRAYSGSSLTFRVDNAGSVTSTGRVTAAPTGAGGASFTDGDNHFWESDGAGGWRFSNRWGFGAANFRFYGGAALDELARFEDPTGGFMTAMHLTYFDNGGTKRFSRVFCVHDSSLDSIVGPNGHILYVTHA